MNLSQLFDQRDSIYKNFSEMPDRVSIMSFIEYAYCIALEKKWRL